MKKLSEVGALVFVFVVVISAVIVVIMSGSRASHTHYVCLEVNPRVEFLTDSKHKVKSLKPLNQEAKELLIGENLLGLDIEDACDKFLNLCASSGYLKIDGHNNAVKLSVLSGLNQGLEVRIAQKINKFFVDNNILGVLVESSQDLQQLKEAKKLGVSSEKYDLMMAVNENNSSLSLDELKKLSNKKLVQKIEESHNNYTFEYSDSDLNNKVKLIDFYRPIYEKHLSSITPLSTRDFKQKLKEFRQANTKKYKVDYNLQYNEWLFG